MSILRTVLVGAFIASAQAISFLPRPLAANPSCGDYTNSTAYTGRVIGNITYDLPANEIYVAGASACCGMAMSFARQRSKNSTNPIAWSQNIVGPSPNRKDQLTLNCTAYDYGATRAHESKHFAGMTAPLAPFPPPPPACSSFKTKLSCPLRCFWAKEVCDATPPIKCAKQEGILVNNGPLCVHIDVNSTKWGEVTYTGNAASYNETVIVAPPKTFKGDAWYSMADGLNVSLNRTAIPSSHLLAVLTTFIIFYSFRVLRKHCPRIGIVPNIA